ncbi:MAG TPA: hypothetical protein VMJ32_10870 [Pirellulales bacterium]|nr:hypothetical protein [Pirellulales bacterium]
MDCESVCPRSRWRLSTTVLVATSMFLGGCQRATEIAHYRVPKEPEVSTPPAETESASTDSPGAASAESAPTDRMLAAMVPHGNAAWTFKLTGSIEAVDKHAAALEGLVQSITFPEKPGGQPQWKLPDGWTQKAGTSEMRLATITIPDEQPPLEISVGMIPWPVAESDERLLMNVNRWRGQMQLKPVDAAVMAENIRTLDLADGKATLIDLKGKFKAGGMTPPFAGAASGPGPLPPGHPPMADSLPTGHPPIADSLPAGHPPAANSSAEQDTASTPDLPFTFTAPSGWKKAALPTFAVAAFAVGENSPRPEVTITPLPESAAGIAANVNRWRAQLGLAAASEDELAAEAKPYKVDGQPAQWVQLVGPERTSPRRSIVAVVVGHDGVNWIFALKAEAAVADSQRANFEKFIGSVKFGPAAN